jgi:hypothetical protein
MNDELQRIEVSVNRFVGKPLARLVYGLRVFARWTIRNAVRGGSRLRQRWAALRNAA